MRRLAILAVQAAIFIVLLEAGLRLFHPIPFRVRGSRIVLPVLQSYTFETHTRSAKLDAVVHHTKNSLGFRGPEPPADLAQRLSLLTIGGSTTECLFLSDGETWTDELTRRIAARRPTTWVNNAGLDGQSTYGHLVLLRDVVAALHPTFAIFLVGINDVGRDDPTSFDSALTPAGGVLHRAMVSAIDHSETLAFAQNLVRSARARRANFGHSEIDVRALRELRLEPGIVARSIAEHDRYLPGYRERLMRIAVFCRAHGIQPIFVTQPALYGPAIDPSTGVDLATRQYTGWGNGEVEWLVLERYNAVTRQVAEAERVPLIDLAMLLPKDSRFFYDHVHYSIEGARRVGGIVADGLERVAGAFQ